MLFADKLGMPKKIKDLAESLDLEVTNHHDPEFDAKLCALIFGELTDKYPSYQELIRKIDDQPKTNNNYWFFVKFGGNLFFISTVFFFLNPIKSCRYVCFLVTLKTPHH